MSSADALGANQMALQIKVLDANADDLTSVPGIHTVKERTDS